MNTINERIATVIETLGLTRTDFANRLKLTQSYVSKLANTDSIPSDRNNLKHRP